MADNVSPAVRSRMMGAIKGKNTKPEMIIRRGLHKRGFRYVLHAKDLPGKPDLYFPKYRAAIFVHGCFWHGHECGKFRWPKTRVEWWREKIGKNIARDVAVHVKLRKTGIRAAVIWECTLVGADQARQIEMLGSWLVSEQGLF